jgi:hypothetical protein
MSKSAFRLMIFRQLGMAAFLAGWLWAGPTPGLAQDTNPVRTKHPLMHFTPEQEQELQQQHLRALQHFTTKALAQTFASSVNLLPRLPYTPSERDQQHCGDCWQWAGTGVMEIAHDVQNGIHDRLSVQFINSCITAKHCCDGGWLGDIATFYATKGYAIPWSNTNARFSSTDGTCNTAPCATIATTPKYPITRISQVSVTTHGVGQAQAIANIKSVLNANQAVWFAFFLRQGSDWTAFSRF